jgi:hypothetical protein
MFHVGEGADVDLLYELGGGSRSRQSNVDDIEINAVLRIHTDHEQNGCISLDKDNMILFQDDGSRLQFEYMQKPLDAYEISVDQCIALATPYIAPRRKTFFKKHECGFAKVSAAHQLFIPHWVTDPAELMLTLGAEAPATPPAEGFAAAGADALDEDQMSDNSLPPDITNCDSDEEDHILAPDITNLDYDSHGDGDVLHSDILLADQARNEDDANRNTLRSYLKRIADDHLDVHERRWIYLLELKLCMSFEYVFTNIKRFQVVVLF